jgi:integrase/recombinase XerD
VRDKRAKLVGAAALYGFGIELMEEGEELSKCDLFHGAVRYRDGLMIALLTARPILRLRNLTDLKIGDGIFKDGEQYGLKVVATEMKQRRHVEVSVPPELSPYLNRYLEHHRPNLFPSTHGWKQPVPGDPKTCLHLWVSTWGKGMDAHSIYCQFVRLTKAKFGKGFGPHFVRDTAATSIALEDPKHVRYAMNVLGHSKFATPSGITSWHSRSRPRNGTRRICCRCAAAQPRSGHRNANLDNDRGRCIHPRARCACDA